MRNQATICTTCGDPKNDDGALHCYQCRNGLSSLRSRPLSQAGRLQLARQTAAHQARSTPELDTWNRTQLSQP